MAAAPARGAPTFAIDREGTDLPSAGGWPGKAGLITPPRVASCGYPGSVALRHVARLAAWGAACAGLPALLGAVLGRPWILSGMAVAVAGTVWLLLWLPRAAHAAFEAARYGPAARRYRVIAVLAFTAARECAALLSRAGCEVAAGRLAAAERILAGFDAGELAAAERVTWLNNRACDALEAGDDPRAALDLAEQAVALRPDVPAVQHTRASALIALGRFDDAIGVLEAMRAGGELSPALEALRCRELARAWDHKGQPDYAADYRDRARLVAR
jgi:tetratricopeptide (TPR) repeat protein